MRFFNIVIVVLLLLVTVCFSVLNAKSVELDLYFSIIHLPMPVLMIFSMALGLVLGLGSMCIKYWRLKRQYSRLKIQFDLIETEVKNLRSIPIQDQH